MTSASNLPPYSYSFFFNTLIVGLFLFAIILVGREAVNWYIKHNAMLEQLSGLRVESSTANKYLKNIEQELRKMRELKEKEGRRKTGRMSSFAGEEQ